MVSQHVAHIELKLWGRRLSLVGILLSLVLAQSAWASEQAAVNEAVRGWLGKLDNALLSVNFVGQAVHQTGDEVRQVRVKQAAFNGERYVRIQHSGGGQSEVIRRGKEFVCLHSTAEPNQFRQTKSLSPKRFKGAGDPERFAELNRFYAFSLLPRKTIGGRQAIGISLKARDTYRLHHRLWVDTATGLLLKGAIISQNDVVLEQFEFTSVDTTVKLTPEDFVVEYKASLPPSVTVREGKDNEENKTLNQALVDQFEWVPSGFSPSKSVVRKQQDKHAPRVESVMFSDGVASFTVFLERRDAAQEAAYQPSALPDVRRGATLTHSRVARATSKSGESDFVVTTVMGEITYNAASKILSAYNGNR